MVETRRLGSIAVSPIGMGCMGLSHGYDVEGGSMADWGKKK